jgi:hypothetical protein
MDFDLFGSKEEALAFIRGMETAIQYVNMEDHLSVSAHPALLDGGDWKVVYGSCA